MKYHRSVPWRGLTYPEDFLYGGHAIDRLVEAVLKKRGHAFLLDGVLLDRGASRWVMIIFLTPAVGFQELEDPYPSRVAGVEAFRTAPAPKKLPVLEAGGLEAKFERSFCDGL